MFALRSAVAFSPVSRDKLQKHNTEQRMMLYYPPISPEHIGHGIYLVHGIFYTTTRRLPFFVLYIRPVERIFFQAT